MRARGEPVWFQLYQRDDWGQTRELLEARRIGRLSGARVHRRSARWPQHGAVQSRVPAQPPAVRRLSPERPAADRSAQSADVERADDACDAAARDRLADLGLRQAAERYDRHEAADQRHRHARGCGAGDAERRRRRVHLESRRTRREQPAADDSVCARRSPPASRDARRSSSTAASGAGTDIFKALALGATAVGVGRPYMWGLASFGQQGVETVLDILRRELQLIMRQSGVTSIGAIAAASLSERR